MSGPIDTDVVIVGGGIVGTSAALALRRMGIQVVLLERDLCGSRSSGVNYGGVRRQGRSAIQLPVSQRAHAIWGRLAETIGIDGEYLRSGHLKLARSAADLAALEAYRDRVRDFGLDLEIISRNALRDRFPWLGDIAVGGSLCAEDGHANPRLVSPAFGRAAARHGADIRERTEVTGLDFDGDRFQVEARTTGQDGAAATLTVRAGFLLNCAGAWAGRIAAEFGEPVPMSAEHPTMAVTEPLPLFMDVSLGVEGGGVYGRQVTRGNCVIGGGRGFALDDLRARPGQDALLSLLHQAADLVPALRHAHVIRSWSGTEGYLPDDEPVIGFSGLIPRLIHGFGFAGAGFQIGPAVGEILAELVQAGAATTPIDGFAITRFTEPTPARPTAPGPQHR